jgi:P4 family phage/plasmid primase-like protien
MTILNDAIELRALAPGKIPYSGYFNDDALFQKYGKELNAQDYNIYSPFNPIRPEAVLRLNEPPKKGSPATKAGGISRRLWLPYDIDVIRAIDPIATAAAKAAAIEAAKATAAKATQAIQEAATKPEDLELKKTADDAIKAADKAAKREAGYSDPDKPTVVRYVAATNEERLAARKMTQNIVNFWRGQAVEPKVLDTGNGFQIFVPIDLPNDEGSEKLVRDVLTAHEAAYATPGAKLDCWSDANRILRVAGYLNVKGNNSPDRPRRVVKQLNLASGLATRAMLEEIRNSSAAQPADKAAPTASAVTERGRYTPENVEVMLAGIAARTPEFNFESGKKNSYGPGFWVTCPNADEHSTPEGAITGLTSTTMVWVNERGFADFRCQHGHCQPLHWPQFVELTKSEDLQGIITKPWNRSDPAQTTAWLGVDADPNADSPSNDDETSPSSVADASPVVAAPFFSDIALAKKFAQGAKGLIAFLDRGVWTYYANGRWRDDDRTALHVRHTVSEFLLHQMPIVDELIPKGEDKEETANARMRRTLKTQLGSAARESSVRSQVQHQPGMFLRVDQFDKNPFLLGAPGGQVIDLKTGSTRPACPEDYLSKSVICSPGGDCPQWLKFMEDITGGDADLQRYLQRMLGYCLTAEVREQCLIVLHGPGGNGKGVLIGTTQYILGDSDKAGYACTVPMDALMMKKNGETDLRNVARMCGARLVVSQESGLQRKFDSGLLKTLTGGDELTGEKKFEHPFNFSPTHKLVVVSNQRPKVDLDGGMRRRLHLVPFQQVYDLDKTKTGAKPPDRMLKEKLLAEAPGILAWMIEGCLAWQQRGLDPPASVLDYTTEFFADNDTLGEWIEQHCDDVRLTDPKAKTPNEELFSDWKTFSDNGRGGPGTHSDFIENLQKKGFEKCRIGNKRSMLGLKIKSTPL